jgi:hypothetical protein
MDLAASFWRNQMSKWARSLASLLQQHADADQPSYRAHASVSLPASATSLMITSL